MTMYLSWGLIQRNWGFIRCTARTNSPPIRAALKKVDDELISAFWDQFACDSESIPDFPSATGVYVIGVRHGKNITPHYIGTSKGYSYRLDFIKERDRIEHIIRKSGTPVIFFLPRVSNKADRKVEGVKKARWILDNMEFVEKWLLGYGIVKNPEIITSEGAIAAIIKELRIEGFVNSQKRGPQRKSVLKLKELLGEETKE